MKYEIIDEITELTLPELERLAILVEECAEVQQIAMKIIRHGYGSYNPFDEKQVSNRNLLNKELGDLKFIMEIMCQIRDVDYTKIKNYSVEKAFKIGKYLHHQETETP